MKKLKAFALILIVLFCAFGFVSCTVPDNEQQDATPIMILHAGGGWQGEKLFNAQETFDYYYALGYRWFEYDLQLSNDGKLIGTHSFEHLSISSADISYNDFKQLKLDNGFTPVNEEWLAQTIQAHPDVKIVVDAKADTTQGDTAVLARIEQLESIYKFDLSANIIPEIFSIEMWQEVQKCTTFDNYLFSHYKVYYSVDTMLQEFSSPKILGVAISTWSDNYIVSNIHRVKDAGKKLFVFTVTNDEELALAKLVEANAIYVDDPTLFADKI